MRRFPSRNIYLVAAIILMISPITVYSAPPSYATAPDLPPGFAVFVPKDFNISNSQTTTGANAAGVSFVADKQDPQHSVILHEYRLNLNMRLSMSQLIQMQEPIYRSQLEKDIAAKRQSYDALKSDPLTGYDPAVVVKFPWGYGISRRQVHHYVGSGTGSDENDYLCEYIGLIIDDTSVKKFEMLVSGVKTSAEADQWANNVVEKIEKTTPANLRD
jgi:hypothetical protein